MSPMVLRALLLLLLVAAGNCHFPLPFPTFLDPNGGSDSSADSSSSYSGSSGDFSSSGSSGSASTGKLGPADFAYDAIGLGYGFGPNEVVENVKPLGPEDFGALDPGTGPGFKGKWEVFKENTGVSAMHMQLFPKINQVLMFDSTIWKISKIKLADGCRDTLDEKNNKIQDCWAHSVLMDIDSGKLTPLKIMGDTWCSSGALTVDGTLVSSGGWKDGASTIRYLGPCDKGCKWREYPHALANERWYSAQVTLPDGKFVVFGGRNSMTYEFVPAEGQKNPKATDFPLLKETNNVPDENNLYPFAYLSTEGNVFVFANNRSVLFDPKSLKVVRELPVLPNGARNYPASAASALLPIVLEHTTKAGDKVKAEVLICGGAQHDAYHLAEQQPKEKKVFKEANKDCGRIDITDPKANWQIETMPSARILGDMMILPTGDALIINGAKKGSAGWNDAQEPNFNPVLYKFDDQYGAATRERFRTLAPSNIPRMYHSVAAVLPDARVLVAGSNTNNGYLYQAEYPTELRAEKFSPPYLDPEKANNKLEIVEGTTTKALTYGGQIEIQVKSPNLHKVEPIKLQVTMYSPPFTTHGVSMNQRLIQLGVAEVNDLTITAMAPPSAKIAPPGYYMLFVNYAGVPSKAVWVQIK